MYHIYKHMAHKRKVSRIAMPVMDGIAIQKAMPILALMPGLIIITLEGRN